MNRTQTKINLFLDIEIQTSNKMYCYTKLYGVKYSIQLMPNTKMLKKNSVRLIKEKTTKNYFYKQFESICIFVLKYLFC